MQELEDSSSAIEHSTADAFDPGRLELILLPTERCNFRCTYCYEDFESGKMSPQVVDAVKNLLRARAGDVQTLHLSWFGGEPLLAKEIVHDINEFASALFAGKNYSAGITTNGYLLHRIEFDRLIRGGTNHFQVSLDGTQEFHDLTRPTLRGQGTFDTIWTNLLATRETAADFHMVLRVHMSPQNVGAIPRLLENIKRAFADDARYRVFLKAIAPLGGPRDSHTVFLGTDDVRRAVADAKKRYSRFINIGSEDDEPGYVCYAAKLNSFLIRADGRIGKCTVALNDSANVIGMLRSDGSMVLDRQKLLQWTGGLFTRDEGQLSCPNSFRRAAQPVRHHLPLVSS